MHYKIIAALFIGALCACQSARELHYFKSDGNYYRLKINERSFASKSRYLSGYFDEKAVEKYFSEMNQPDSGKFAEWVTGPEKRGAQLVMILSTNSNSIAEQIGNLASNEILLENIAILANKDKIEKAREQANELEVLRRTAGTLQIVSQRYFAGADSSNIKTNVADFLSYLRLRLDARQSLLHLDSAIKKFQIQ